MLIIEKPEARLENGELKLVAALTGDAECRLGALQQQVWFAVPEAYEAMVYRDCADPFLLGLLYFAMWSGSDLHVRGRVSRELLRQLNEDAIPMICAYCDRCRPIRVTADEPSDFACGTGVGTGLSGGIDSFYSIVRHLPATPGGTNPLSMLCFFNVGTHGFGNTPETLAFADEKFRARYEKFRPIAEAFGLPLVTVNSNICSFLPDDYLLVAITFANAAAIHLLKKAVGTYFIASAGYNYATLIDYLNYQKPHDRLDSAQTEPVLGPLLSIAGLRIIPDGTAASRIEKLQLIADHPVAVRHLNVCNSASVVDCNCSVCYKCRRTLTDLAVLGRLDAFRETLDVDRYRRDFQKRDWAMLKYHAPTDYFSEMTLKYAREHGVDVEAGTTFMDCLCARLNGSRVYCLLKKIGLLNVLKRLLGRKTEIAKPAAEVTSRS